MKNYLILHDRGSSNHAVLFTSKRANNQQKRLSKLLKQSDFKENGNEKSVSYALILFDTNAKYSSIDFSLLTETILLSIKNFGDTFIVFSVKNYFSELILRLYARF